MTGPVDPVAVFPGQGSQRAGMGRHLVQQWSGLVSPLFRAAGEIVGFDVARLCSEGSLETLSDTAVTQPAVYTVSVATLEVLRQQGVEFAATAGHSLGEFAALVCAGVLDWRDGLRLVQQRGRLMAQVGARSAGTMAAVIGVPAGRVEQLCADARDRRAGTVEVANYNESEQTVVSGETRAVEQVASAAEGLGARVVPLQVSAPFHCSLMAEIQDEFAAALAACPLTEPELPLVANATGDWVRSEAEIRAALCAQLAGPVRWTATLARLGAAGHRSIVEVGPGRVLSGLVRSALPDARAWSTGDGKRLDAVLDRWGAAVASA